MSDITAISALLQSYQSTVQNNLGMVAIKQAAQSEQEIADMLAKNMNAAAQVQPQAGKGGISIYA